MKIYPFGGANEIGASSTLIEIEKSRILVDAGIRMRPGQTHSCLLSRQNSYTIGSALTQLPSGNACTHRSHRRATGIEKPLA